MVALMQELIPGDAQWGYHMLPPLARPCCYPKDAHARVSQEPFGYSDTGVNAPNTGRFTLFVCVTFRQLRLRAVGN